MNIGGRESYQESEKNNDRNSVDKNQNKNKARQENQKWKNDLEIEGRGEGKQRKSNLKKEKQSGKETMGKEDERQENQGRKGYSGSRKTSDPRSEKSRNLAMRHMVGELGGHSAECIVGTDLFPSCSHTDSRVQLPPSL